MIDNISDQEKTAIKRSFEAYYGAGLDDSDMTKESWAFYVAWIFSKSHQQSISNSFSQSQPESSDLAATLKKKNAEIGWLRAKAARVQAELNELAVMLDKL